MTCKIIFLDGPRPPRVLSIFDITDKSAEVHWKSGYEDSDASAPNNLYHNVTLYRFVGDTKVQRYVDSKLATSSNFVKFSEGIESIGRYNVRVFSQYKYNGDIIKSTTKDLAFRADAGR